MDGSTGRRIPPLIMSHEASGIIAGVRSYVKTIQPGERVTFDSTVYCGSCASRGEYPACLDMIAAGSVNVDSLITAVAPLAEADSWFRRVYQKEIESTKKT
jgi:threonine dehydrogenase-like Zn-dependent dehydrogenase